MVEYPVPRKNVAGNMYGREDAIFAMKCIDPPMGCGKEIAQEEFQSWSPLTRKEYTMSGWCNTCQNRVFASLLGEGACTCEMPSCCEADVGVGIIYCNHPVENCPVHGGFSKQSTTGR
jgi:hypothetical protein